MIQLSQNEIDALKSKFQVWGTASGISPQIGMSRPENDLFSVVTVKTITGLKNIDTTLMRPDSLKDPEKAFVIGIEGSNANVYSQRLPVSTDEADWDLEFTITGATDCAIEFDGYWVHNKASQRWNLQTFGMPWVFWIDQAGSLWCQHWLDINSKIEISTNVERVNAIRGWKSAVDSSRDQGIVVAYTKAGAAFYRNYSTQEDLSTIWESEKAIADFTENIVEIGLFRTNDYRLGFLAEIVTGLDQNDIYWSLTKQNFGGFGALSETMQAGISSFEITLLECRTLFGYFDETMHGSTDSFDLWFLCDNTTNSFTSAKNVDDGNGNWGFFHEFTLEYDIIDIDVADFSLKDSRNRNFLILSIEYVCPQTYKMHTSDINNAKEYLTISFLGSGATKGGLGSNMSAFSAQYVPTNLAPSPTPAPTVIKVFNI